MKTSTKKNIYAAKLGNSQHEKVAEYSSQNATSSYCFSMTNIYFGKTSGRYRQNGRTGKSKEKEYPLREYTDEKKNTNEETIMNFCIENNMVICNTFFKHRDVHKCTRVMESMGEESIVDLALIRREDSKLVNEYK